MATIAIALRSREKSRACAGTSPLWTVARYEIHCHRHSKPDEMLTSGACFGSHQRMDSRISSIIYAGGERNVYSRADGIDHFGQDID